MKDLDLTKAFYKYIFPDESIIKRKISVPYRRDINPVIWKSIILFGSMGSGKTETVRRIVEEAVNKYGSNKVNAIIDETGNLGNLVNNGLSPKMCNILICDNLTLSKPSNLAFRQFFNIRHLYKQRFNKKNGYILNIMGVHRFHGCNPELRTNLDAIIIRNSTLNPYDRNVLLRFTSDELMHTIERIEANRLGVDKLMEISIFATKTFKGILRTPMSTKNYLKVCYSPVEGLLQCLNLQHLMR